MPRVRHPRYAALLSQIDEIDREFARSWDLSWRGGLLIEPKRKIGTTAPAKPPRALQGFGAILAGTSHGQILRPTAPIRPPPKSGDGLKHFGLIHDTIYKQNGKRHAPTRAVYIEAGGALDGLIGAEARATSAALYAEGHASSDPERVVWIDSNIADTFAGRIDFWRKVEANTRPAIDATVSVDIRGHEAAWAAIGVEGMQRDVRRAYEAAVDGDGHVTVVVNSADAAWRYSGAKQHRALFAQTLKTERQANDTTMCTIIAPLPHRLSWEGKQALARDYSEFFRQRGLPVQAVIHEPVKGKNDARNWHVHLNYYPFPVHRHPEHDGKWSFERVRYYSDSSRKWRQRRIERVPRLDETRPGNDWVPKIKQAFCDMANRRLESEGLRPTFTTLTNNQRGRGEAEQRRGPKVSALRKRGQVDNAEIEAARALWAEQADADATRRALSLGSAVNMRLRTTDSATRQRLLASAREAGDLREIMVRADWKAREIRSGVDFVEAEQRKVAARTPDGATAPESVILAREVIDVCATAQRVFEADLLLRLRKVKAEAQRRYRALTLSISARVVEAESMAAAQEARQPTIVAPNDIAMASAEATHAARQQRYAAGIVASIHLGGGAHR